MIGSTISHYQIIAQIGAGGMAVVYEAEDLVLKRRVAIKTLKDSNSKAGRLLREARAISKISHPNIATIYDYGKTEDGRPFIVMELVRGKRFDEWMREEKPELHSVVEVMMGVVRGISAAHSRQIVHRDIKPSNIIIDESGVVKVLDFGLSKQLKEYLTESGEDADLTRTQDGAVIGTPLYLSPEQASSTEVDERSDIFSLGTLFYEAITGRSPFYSESVFETCAKILRDEPVRPSGVNREIPKAFDRVVRMAMAKDPAKRYQTAQEFLAGLEGLQKAPSNVVITGPVDDPAARISISQRMLTSFRDVIRYPYVSALVFLIAAVVGISFFLLLGSNTYKPNEKARDSYNRGVAAFNDGLNLAATSYFNDAIRADGSYVLAYARKAEVLRETGYIDEAKEELGKANNAKMNLPSDVELSTTDELRLKAINNTLDLNFDAAVGNYSTLASYAREVEKPEALLDLGRAYERVQNWGEAIKAYQRALEYPTNLPAANLRLAVLFGQKLDREQSDKYFAEAARLYGIQGSPEANIEVSYQKGLVIFNTNDAKAALPDAEESLKLADANKILYQQIKCRLLLSKILRSTNSRKDALVPATQGVKLAQDSNINELHAQSVLELGTVYLFIGQNDEAQKTYHEALLLSQTNNLKLIEHRVLLQFASLAVRNHKGRYALERVDQIRSFFEAGGYQKEMLDLLSIEALAYTSVGNLEKALAIYQDLKERATRSDDPAIKARAIKGIGTILVGKDELPAAIQELDESYSLNNSLHKTFEAGFALVLKAEVHAHLGRYDDADAYLNQAEGLAQQNEALVPRIDLGRAKIALSKQNYPEVIRISKKMFKEDANAGDQKNELPSSTEVRSLLAVALVRSGQKADAKKLIDSFDLTTHNLEEKEMLAMFYLSKAEIALGNDRYEDAVEAAKNAKTLFNQLEKSSFEWQASALLGRAQERLGRIDEARAAQGDASVTYSTLAQKWGDYFKTYPARAEVGYYLGFLGN